MNGNFVLSGLSESAELVFSFVGYKEKILSPNKDMRVVLEEDGDTKYEPEKVEGEISEVFVIVEEMPKFQGGKAAFENYTKEIFGAEMKGSGIAIKFIVESDGSINSVSYKADELEKDKVDQFINKMPTWVPGKQRGKAVRVQQTVKL